MASLYFYKARSFFLLDQMKYQRRISHLMTSGGEFHYVGSMLTTSMSHIIRPWKKRWENWFAIF